jgi:hypothetical protein
VHPTKVATIAVGTGTALMASLSSQEQQDVAPRRPPRRSWNVSRRSTSMKRIVGGDRICILERIPGSGQRFAGDRDLVAPERGAIPSETVVRLPARR